MKKLILTMMASFFVSLVALDASELPVDNEALVFTELTYPEHLPIVKRTDWGWKPITKNFKTHTIQYLTVHHGGTEFHSTDDSLKHVNNLQSWSRSEKQWIDIPYHFMIDPSGTIYETRPVNIPGDTNTEYDPTSHLLIEVMGNFETQILPNKQLDSLVVLLSFLAQRFEINSADVKTHRDYSKQTVCPGRNVYKLFENGTMQVRLDNMKAQSRL